MCYRLSEGGPCAAHTRQRYERAVEKLDRGGTSRQRAAFSKAVDGMAARPDTRKELADRVADLAAGAPPNPPDEAAILRAAIAAGNRADAMSARMQGAATAPGTPVVRPPLPTQPPTPPDPFDVWIRAALRGQTPEGPPPAPPTPQAPGRKDEDEADVPDWVRRMRIR